MTWMATGCIDLVVADIGEFNAEDSDLGRVVWLRRKPDSEKFEKIVLQEELSRVADVNRVTLTVTAIST